MANQVTSEFTISPSVSARRYFTRIAVRYWWCAAIPVATFLALGTADWRWLVVALAVIFILAPTSAMFAWLAIASRPESVNGIFPHSIHLSDSGDIIIEYLQLPKNEEAETTDNDIVATATRIPPARTIAKHDITSIHIEGNYVVVCHMDKTSRRKAGATELIIPLKAFGSRADINSFFREIDVKQPIS